MKMPVNKSFLTVASILYDAVYVPGGANSVATLAATADAVHFLNEAYKHCKAIDADRQAMQTLKGTYFYSKLPDAGMTASSMRKGVLVGENGNALTAYFIEASKIHRFWEREKHRKVPA